MKHMKILVFLQGTLIMHKSAISKTREQIIRQVKDQGESVRDFHAYVPIGSAVEKLKNWAKQGAKVIYLSALTEGKKARGYAQIVERAAPDIFIKPEIKRKIKSIAIKEFGGIDHLPDDLSELSKYEN